MAYDAHLAQDLGGLADQPSYPAKPVTPATLCTAMTYNIIMYILYSQIALHAALPDSTAYGDYREDSSGKASLHMLHMRFAHETVYPYLFRVCISSISAYWHVWHSLIGLCMRLLKLLS